MIEDMDSVRVLKMGLVVGLGLGLVTLLQSSFIGTKTVGIVSVGIVCKNIVWCTYRPRTDHEFFSKTANIIYKKLQAIYLMLYKR